MRETTSIVNTGLSVDQIYKMAPSVFADRPWDGVSDKYKFIPTESVMQTLIAEGWLVTGAKEQRTRIEEKKGFTKHILRFRRPTESNLAKNDLFPELVLLNSHDRGSAYQLHAGMFRLVCLNGMIVADSTLAKISVRHSGEVLDEVRYGAEKISKALPGILDNVEQMQTIDLTPNERGIFARAALMTKYHDHELENTTLIPTDLLVRRRMADNKTDLFTTFNVVQENLIKGGLRYQVVAHRDEKGFHSASRRKTRKINSIAEDTRINKALWTLADEMRKLKAAA